MTSPLDRHPDDELHRLARAAISMVPGLGSILLEIFTGLIAEPAQARRDALLRELMERILDLEQRSIVRLDDLRNRPEFLATFIRGAQAASREIENKKTAHLKNAILNTAIGDDLTSSLRSTLLSILERVSTAHIMVLAKVNSKPIVIERLIRDDLKRYRSAAECSNPKPTGDAEFPYYDGEEVELRHGIIGELFTFQLIRYDIASIGEERTPQFGALSSKTVLPSAFGKKLLQLIQEPDLRLG